MLFSFFLLILSCRRRSGRWWRWCRCYCRWWNPTILNSFIHFNQVFVYVITISVAIHFWNYITSTNERFNQWLIIFSIFIENFNYLFRYSLFSSKILQLLYQKGEISLWLQYLICPFCIISTYDLYFSLQILQ